MASHTTTSRATFAHARTSLALIATFGFGSLALAQDQTIQGNLSVTGATDIGGDTLSLGSRTDSSVIPGVNVIYDDAAYPTINFSATRAGATWVWHSDTSTPQLQLTGTNTLTLFNSTTGTVGIVLNPDGTSSLAGGLTVNGVFSVPNGAFSGGASGLTLNAGGTENQNITLVPTGAGKTVTASPVAVTASTISNTPSTGALTVAGGVGIGGDLNLAGDLRVGSSLTSNQIRFYGTNQDGDGNFGNTIIAERLYAGTDRSELLLFKGDDVDPSAGPGTTWGDRIRLDTPGSIIFQTGGGYRSYAPAVEGETVMTLNSAGRVLVGSTTDDGSSKMQVSGNVKINGELTTTGTVTASSITLPDGSLLTSARTTILYNTVGQAAATVDASGNVNVATGLSIGTDPASAPTLSSGASGLTLNAGGTGNQNITLVPTGTGSVGVGGDLNLTGELRVGSGLTSNQIRFYGTNHDGDGSFGNTVIAERLYAGIDRSELLLFKGNDVDPSSGPGTNWGERIRLDTPGSIIFQTGGGYRSYSPGVEGATVMTLNSAGRVLVGTTADDGSSKLQVSGNVKVDGALNLFNPTTSTVGIVLNPNGMSSLAGGLTVNGVFSAPNGAFSGGASGLTLNAGGTGNQNITLVPTGAGKTVTASPVAVTATTTSNTPSTGALTVAGGVGVGGNLSLAGDLRVGSSLTSNQIRFYGTNHDGDGNFNNTVIAERLYAGIDRSELLLFKGNDVDPSAGPGTNWGERIRLDTPGSIIFQTGGGYRSYSPGVEGATVMTLNSAGRVLVGTTADDGSSKLQVSGNVKVNGALTSTGTVTASSFTLLDGTSLTSGHATALYNTGGQVAATVDASGKVNIVNGLAIGTDTSATTTAKLEVAGDAKINGNLTVTGLVTGLRVARQGDISMGLFTTEPTQ